VGVSVPYYPWTVWIWAAFDPILILVSVYLGWTASQFGKVVIAAIIGFAVAVLASWCLSSLGLPWPAPIGHDLPTFFPVRAVGALLWAIAGFGARRLVRPRA
jgi:hypothetical protein